MFKVFVGYDLGVYDSLKAACRAFLEFIAKKLKTEGGSYQWLETFCWIERPNELPLMFYDARDYAIDQGWLENGTGRWIG